MTRVAVLGANGFVGSYICNNLKNHIILPVSRKTCNLNDYSSVGSWLASYVPDIVINCATAGGKARMGDHSYIDLQNNLSLFLNFYNNSHRFSKFINIGSGAEFDKSTSINLAQESSILNCNPTDSYSLSKNIIARLCLEKENFYTLRLFGIFDQSEPDIRLLKKCSTQQTIIVNDCLFDMFSASDFLRVLNYYIDTERPKYQDINCVYDQKQNLESIVRRFASIHNNDLAIEVISTKEPKNYTGSGDRLKELGIDLLGLDAGLEHYG